MVETTMTGLNISQLKKFVVEPALTFIGLNEPVAINLVTGTAIVESGAQYLHQVGSGPALGLFQMEPATEQDCWVNYLKYLPSVEARIKSVLAPGETTPQLVYNLFYAAIMCRIKYKRAKEALPENTALALATYHKNIYNSALGAANIANNVPGFQFAISS
jgi:hypothetical protein